MTAEKLTIRQVAAIRPNGKKQVFNDGGGVRLIVEPNGNKRLVIRMMINGKDIERGLGGYPAVSLKDAREAAAKIRQALRAGGGAHPVSRIGPAASTEPVTLEMAARTVYAEHEAKWRLEGRHKAQNWIGRMQKFVFPSIGNVPLRDLTGKHMHAVFQPIWTTMGTTARRLRSDLRLVFKTASLVERQCGREAIFAIDDAVAVLGKQPPKKHHAAIDVEDLPGFMRDLYSMDVDQSLRLCMAFVVLTVKRSQDVREAEWREYNEATGVWTIPAKRMKVKDKGDHPEPLSDAARHVLRLAKQAAGDNKYMFPNPVTGGPYWSNPLRDLLKGYGSTVHGLRATMSTWAYAETIDYNGSAIKKYAPDVIELALAHKAYGAIAAAYQRGKLLDLRLALANDWAKAALGDRPVPQLLLAA